MANFAQDGAISVGRGARTIMWFAGLMIAAFVIQVLPATGIFTMFFGGLFWIGILIYALLAALLIQVFWGLISPMWLFVPATYLLGGYGLHILSITQAEADIAVVHQNNARMSTKVKSPLTFDIAEAERSVASATNILVDYGIEEASLLDNTHRFNRITHFYIAAPKECATMPPPFSSDDPMQKRLTFNPFPSGYCVVRSDASEPMAHYIISSQILNRRGLLLNARGERFTLHEAASGRVLSIAETGKFSSLAALPFVLAGCSLIDGPSTSWQCGVHLAHSKTLLCTDKARPNSKIIGPVFGMPIRKEDLSASWRTAVMGDCS